MAAPLSDDRIEYYSRRVGQGIIATRNGISETALTKTIVRWGEPVEVFMDDRLDMRSKVQFLLKLTDQLVDAVDAEDELAPYRFQRVGEMWEINYAISGVVKRGVFKDHRGLQHYAKLLANPHTAVKSVQLAGKTDEQTLAIIQGEKELSSIKRHDAASIETYKGALELLKEQLESAKLKSDVMEMERLEHDIDQLTNILWPGTTKGTKPKFNTLHRQTIGKSKTEEKIHDAVATAMRRAIETLIDSKRGKMVELARFLEMSVNPDGYAFAYRPVAPEPGWLL